MVLMPTKDETLYNTIGQGYVRTRQEDPDIYARIVAALGSAQTVVNIGAGTGSYEPRHLKVTAVEPSDVMIRQRKSGSAPAVKATADALPFKNKSFDAAMTVLSVHHWYPLVEKGLMEMCRVARDRVVIVTIDPRVSGQMWLLNDYLKDTAELDNRTFPLPEDICRMLGGKTSTEMIPISQESPDWSLMSFWAHPERVLDPVARAGTSGFARMQPEKVDAIVEQVKRDLDSGAWDGKYGHLRGLKEYDGGLRLITAELDS